MCPVNAPRLGGPVGLVASPETTRKGTKMKNNDAYKTTYHRDHTVTIWDVYAQQWVRTDHPSDAILASLMPDERERVMRHCGIEAD